MLVIVGDIDGRWWDVGGSQWTLVNVDGRR